MANKILRKKICCGIFQLCQYCANWSLRENKSDSDKQNYSFYCTKYEENIPKKIQKGNSYDCIQAIPRWPGREDTFIKVDDGFQLNYKLIIHRT